MDPLCVTCSPGLNLCIQCNDALHRVIKLPEHICVCKEGYYQNGNNVCVPCKEGCQKCRSATQCDSCVVSAISNNDGSCRCPTGSNFEMTSTGVRYCKTCKENCVVCSSSGACLSCNPGFQLTNLGNCICLPGSYADGSGSCVPCSSGCRECDSTGCKVCVSPLLVQ